MVVDRSADLIDCMCHLTSLPAAVMANTVYVALQLGKREEDAFVTTKLRRSGMADRELTLSFHPLVFLEWFIVLGAVINMLYLFFYRAKRYQLRYTDEEVCGDDPFISYTTLNVYTER